MNVSHAERLKTILKYSNTMVAKYAGGPTQNLLAKVVNGDYLWTHNIQLQFSGGYP